MQNHKKFGKTLAIFFSLFLVFVFAAQVNAATTDPAADFGLTDAAQIKVSTDETTNLKTVIANVVNIALGFLGIIAVIIIIYAGFKWMTAAGNEDQVGEAKKMLTQAVMGLVVIFLAWVIANFAITQISNAVTTPAG